MSTIRWKSRLPARLSRRTGWHDPGPRDGLVEDNTRPSRAVAMHSDVDGQLTDVKYAVAWTDWRTRKTAIRLDGWC